MEQSICRIFEWCTCCQITQKNSSMHKENISCLPRRALEERKKKKKGNFLNHYFNYIYCQNFSLSFFLPRSIVVDGGKHNVENFLHHWAFHRSCDPPAIASVFEEISFVPFCVLVLVCEDKLMMLKIEIFTTKSCTLIPAISKRPHCHSIHIHLHDRKKCLVVKEFCKLEQYGAHIHWSPAKIHEWNPLIQFYIAMLVLQYNIIYVLCTFSFLSFFRVGGKWFINFHIFYIRTP